MSGLASFRLFLLFLFLVQFVLIVWKMIAILRIQRDLEALNAFVHTWGERMLTKTVPDPLPIVELPAALIDAAKEKE